MTAIRAQDANTPASPAARSAQQSCHPAADRALDLARAELTCGQVMLGATRTSLIAAGRAHAAIATNDLLSALDEAALGDAGLGDAGLHQVDDLVDGFDAAYCAITEGVAGLPDPLADLALSAYQAAYDSV